MARLIVWAKHDEPVPEHMIRQMYTRGDVIAILEDGQRAGTETEKGEWWRIVDVPGATRAEMMLFMSQDPRPYVHVLAPNHPRKRVYKVPLDMLEEEAGLKPYERPWLALVVHGELPCVPVAPKRDKRVIGEEGIG